MKENRRFHFVLQRFAVRAEAPERRDPTGDRGRSEGKAQAVPYCESACQGTQPIVRTVSRTNQFKQNMRKIL